MEIEAFPKIHFKVLEAVQKRDPKARPQVKLKRHTQCGPGRRLHCPVPKRWLIMMPPIARTEIGALFA